MILFRLFIVALALAWATGWVQFTRRMQKHLVEESPGLSWGRSDEAYAFLIGLALALIAFTVLSLLFELVTWVVTG